MNEEEALNPQESESNTSLVSTDRLVLSSPFIDGDWIMSKEIRKHHIYLADAPTTDEEAANKAYVDSKVASADTLEELLDVTLDSPADNELLAYDSALARWINQTAGEAGVATAAALTTHKTSGDHDTRYYTKADKVVREVPSGLINGANVTFVLASEPSSGTEELYLNGILQADGGNDYSIVTDTITMEGAPQTDDTLVCSYSK